MFVQVFNSLPPFQPPSPVSFSQCVSLWVCLCVCLFLCFSLPPSDCLSVFNYECHLHDLTISYSSLSLSQSLTRYCPSFSDPLLSLSISLSLSLSPLSISITHSHTHTHTSSACHFDIKSKKQNRSFQKQNRAPTFYQVIN